MLGVKLVWIPAQVVQLFLAGSVLDVLPAFAAEAAEVDLPGSLDDEAAPPGTRCAVHEREKVAAFSTRNADAGRCGDRGREVDVQRGL